MVEDRCSTVRFSLSETNCKDRVLTDILYCNKIGLSVTLIIKTCNIQAIYADGATARDGEDRFWDVMKHSEIDVDKYEAWISERLQEFYDAGAVVDVIEVGNKFAWVDFNGDFPVMAVGSGVVYNRFTAWENIPESVRVGVWNEYRRCRLHPAQR